MIRPTWQKIGESTHLLAQRVGKEVAKKTKSLDDLKATHTGTLDPMAEGVVVVLTGEDRFKKAEFSGWKKTYQFEILFGVSTDSLDLLGLPTEIFTTYNVTQTDAKQKSKIKNLTDITTLTKNLEKVLPNFTGSQTQTQPKFSSQRIAGKSGFDLAKTNKRFTAKENEIEIYSLKILDQYNSLLLELKKEILKKLSYITGDFRQGKIKLEWEKTFSKLEKLEVKTLPIIKLEVEASKRTYVRAVVRDIAKKLELPATTFSIIRTKNGKFTRPASFTSLL